MYAILKRDSSSNVALLLPTFRTSGMVEIADRGDCEPSPQTAKTASSCPRKARGNAPAMIGPKRRSPDELAQRPNTGDTVS